MLSRQRRRAVICMMLLLFFGPVALTGGVCALKSRTMAANDGPPCLISLDVCGTGGAAAAAHGLDAVSMPDIDNGSYFPALSALPAEPAPAVASAFAGDVEKPPKA